MRKETCKIIIVRVIQASDKINQNNNLLQRKDNVIKELIREKQQIVEEESKKNVQMKINFKKLQKLVDRLKVENNKNRKVNISSLLSPLQSLDKFSENSQFTSQSTLNNSQILLISKDNISNKKPKYQSYKQPKFRFVKSGKKNNFHSKNKGNLLLFQQQNYRVWEEN